MLEFDFGKGVGTLTTLPTILKCKKRNRLLLLVLVVTMEMFTTPANYEITSLANVASLESFDAKYLQAIISHFVV